MNLEWKAEFESALCSNDLIYTQILSGYNDLLFLKILILVVYM